MLIAIGEQRLVVSSAEQSMEDKDVNPLIESAKPFSRLTGDKVSSRLLHDSREKFVKFCNKYRSEIFLGTSILLVSLCLGVILSILFQGGKPRNNPVALICVQSIILRLFSEDVWSQLCVCSWDWDGMFLVLSWEINQCFLWVSPVSPVCPSLP